MEGCAQTVSSCVFIMLGHELFQRILGNYSAVYWSVKEETLNPHFISVFAELLGVEKNMKTKSVSLGGITGACLLGAVKAGLSAGNVNLARMHMCMLAVPVTCCQSIADRIVWCGGYSTSP